MANGVLCIRTRVAGRGAGQSLNGEAAVGYRYAVTGGRSYVRGGGDRFEAVLEDVGGIRRGVEAAVLWAWGLALG